MQLRTPLSVFVVLGLVVAPGCRHHRSQLLGPVLADDTVTATTLTALRASPLQERPDSRVTLEWEGHVSVYSGTFDFRPPDTFSADLGSTLGGAVLRAWWDADGEHLEVESSSLESRVRGIPSVLGLWLLGNCTDGIVWEGVNGLAVDCAAGGEDSSLVWRIWFDTRLALRLRGELLDGDRLIGDYTCDPSGRCVLQDLLRGTAVRVIPH